MCNLDLDAMNAPKFPEYPNIGVADPEDGEFMIGMEYSSRKSVVATDPTKSVDCADCARYAGYADCDDWPRHGRWTYYSGCTGCGDCHGYHDCGLVAVVYNKETAQTLHTKVVPKVLAMVLVAVDWWLVWMLRNVL
ncbi:hypothetical protein AHAS_Ahas20G0075000 [Arachis hypogaea]